jgi:hypothetical protein
MSLEFIIIPIDPECGSYASEIKSAIEGVVPSNIVIDVDYNLSLTKKLLKYKKTGTDIITLVPESINKRILTVRYGDKGSKPETISLEDFIELVKSYYEEGTKEHIGSVEEVSNEAIKGEGEQDGGSSCHIM